MLIRLQPTTIDDFETLLAIKSDPEEIRWSGFSGPPDRKHFKHWFENALRNPDRIMFNGLINDQFCAYIHFRRLEETVFTVSTGVKSEFRSRGFGTELRRIAIEEMKAKFPNIKIEAWLADRNVASQRSWTKMGYRPTEVTREQLFLSPERSEVMRRWVCIE